VKRETKAWGGWHFFQLKAKGPEATESRQPKGSMRRQQCSEAVAVHHFTSATPFNKTVQKCEHLKAHLNLNNAFLPLAFSLFTHQKGFQTESSSQTKSVSRLASHISHKKAAPAKRRLPFVKQMIFQDSLPIRSYPAERHPARPFSKSFTL
jgi:hypothetical protein